MKKIAITGATGHLGRLVVQKLKVKDTGHALVGLVRSPEKAADLGIETRQADYNHPDTLKTALQGVDTLLLISGSEVGQRAAQHQNVIAAAQHAGVKWIIYTSLLHADTSTLSLAGEHRATEQTMKDSGIPYTILRNGWYTENYTNSIGASLANGKYLGSAGEGKISSAARADYADAAVTVLTGSGHQGKIYELAGDQAYTLKELAAEVSRQTGTELPYNNLSQEEYAAALVFFGLSEGFAQAIASWDVSASEGALFDDSRQLSRLIGRPTTPLAASVTEALQTT